MHAATAHSNVHALVSCIPMKAVAAQVQPAAGDVDATRRRQSLQWGDADEGSGFPGRMPEHDAEDDYEELLQVGQSRPATGGAIKTGENQKSRKDASTRWRQPCDPEGCYGAMPRCICLHDA
jgi:hypothetical protein